MQPIKAKAELCLLAKVEFAHIGFGSNMSMRAVRKMTSAKDQGSIKIEKNEIGFYSFGLIF